MDSHQNSPSLRLLWTFCPSESDGSILPSFTGKNICGVPGMALGLLDIVHTTEGNSQGSERVWEGSSLPGQFINSCTGRQQRCYHRPRAQTYWSAAEIFQNIACSLLFPNDSLHRTSQFMWFSTLLSWDRGVRPNLGASLCCTTAPTGIPQCLELGSGQAQRKYDKAFMMMCVKNPKGGREGSTGNLWVSGQAHLSTLPRLLNLCKSNCVISQRRWTLSRDVKGGTKGSCLGQSSKCLFELMAWVTTSISDFQLQEFVTWLCL